MGVRKCSAQCTAICRKHGNLGPIGSRRAGDPPAFGTSFTNRRQVDDLHYALIVGLALAATGQINICAAPFLYALGYLAVIFNSLRLVRFGEEFGEHEQAQRRIETGQPVKPTRESAPATA